MSETSLKELDIILIFLFNLLFIVFILFPPLNKTPLRIIFGLPLVLFLPGYLLIGVLFPSKNDLSIIERTAFSFLFSLAIVPLMGLVLNFTPFGIRLEPILFVLLTFNIFLSLVAWIRRFNLPAEERFRVPFERLLKINLGQSVMDKVLSIVLIAAIIGSFVIVIYIVVTPKTGERFTEFYLLGPNGIASDYPTDLAIGEEGKVIIGIVNHEYENTTYRLKVNFNGSVVYEKYIFLIKNEKKEIFFTLESTKKGENQKLGFLLYKDNHIEIYRELHLWINIT